MFNFLQNPKLQDFFTLALSIIIEALPFILIGVLISTFVGLFVSEKFFTKFIPKNRFLSHFGISFIGMFMPVCECGNVPVARRFLTKGFNVSHSITFLLAAPIVNPVTFISTLAAFSLQPYVAYTRILSGVFIATTLGVILSYKKNQEKWLNEKFYNEEVCCAHNHHSKSKLKEGLEIFSSEFMENMKMMCIGALIAALSQSIIPREIILSIGQNPVLSIVSMILLAFIISICSNVDAFFALAYSTTFTMGSILSFLIFGPIVDIKMLLMMKNTYKAKLLGIITLYVTLISVLIGLIVNFIT